MDRADLALSTARFYPSDMKHRAIDLMLAITMASGLSGCTSVVDDVDMATTEPSSRPSPRPPVAMLPPAVATPTFSAAPDPQQASRSIEALLLSGEHPLAGAAPGSEQVVLSLERSRGFPFALPARARGVYLWIAVRCRRPVPLSLLAFDAAGRTTLMYTPEQCPATDLVAGPLDTTETRGILTIPNGSPMHFTLVSGKLANADDRPGTRWPRKFLR
ncbi:hypothetical protein DQ353_05475 [Arthrobacter sp. AQ5-05]|uniref:hypothetical protein n=1 Tax=Arthrobacter sp. AQ5-05 TaxID=2184581 RepID=UPI000DCC884D|nr:hypothetical protein [Arthrobacter sp. AQ5-05]RAX50394.1 hypothetical protein DQ353_05475 [Arthrobacter sp. AQ5-05]